MRWPLSRDGDAVRFGPPQTLLDSSASRMHACAYSADGTVLIVASYSAGEALVFSGDYRAEPRRIGPHVGMSRLALSPNNEWLATGTWKGTGVKIWSFESGELVKDLPVEGSARVRFSPDGKWLVTGGTAEHCIWRTGTWEIQAKLPRSESRFGPSPIAISPNSQLLAVVDSTSPLKLTLVDLTTQLPVASVQCPGNIAALMDLRFSSDGTRLLFPHPQKSHNLCVWNLRVIRAQLATMNLDWDLPSYPPATSPEPSSPLRVEVDLGELAPAITNAD